MYRHKMTNRQIITGNTAAPKSAGEFLAELNHYSSRK
jgi:hypothetical protein